MTRTRAAAPTAILASAAALFIWGSPVRSEEPSRSVEVAAVGSDGALITFPTGAAVLVGLGRDAPRETLKGVRLRSASTRASVFVFDPEEPGAFPRTAFVGPVHGDWAALAAVGSDAIVVLGVADHDEARRTCELLAPRSVFTIGKSLERREGDSVDGEVRFAQTRAWMDSMGGAGQFHATADLEVKAGPKGGALVVTAKAGKQSIALELEDGTALDTKGLALEANEKRSLKLFARDGQSGPSEGGEVVFEAKLGTAGSSSKARIQKVD